MNLSVDGAKTIVMEPWSDFHYTAKEEEKRMKCPLGKKAEINLGASRISADRMGEECYYCTPREQSRLITVQNLVPVPPSVNLPGSC